MTSSLSSSPPLQFDGELMAWTILACGIRIVLSIALASLASQVRGLGGTHGLYPIGRWLNAIRTRCTTTPTTTSTNATNNGSTIVSISYKRFIWFPTIYWLNHSDTFVYYTCIGASLTSLLSCIGGAASRPLLLVSWITFLSLSTVLSEFVCFPWDCLLLEMSFLALFLPNLLPIWSTGGLASLPSSCVQWAFRLLMFRLMWGMGKLKFCGEWTSDITYTKSFMCWQPLPTRAARMIHRAPYWFHAFSLTMMMVAEMLLPWIVLLPPSLTSGLLFDIGRAIMVIAFLGMQLFIQIIGNYGTFNILTALLSLPWAPWHWFTSSTATIATSSPAVWTVMIFLYIGNMVYIPLCSWCTTSYLLSNHACYYCDTPAQLSPSRSRQNVIRVGSSGLFANLIHFVPVKLITLLMATRWLPDSIAHIYRILSPYHLVHAYGVFPPKVIESFRRGYRPVLVIEGTRDNVQWATYQPRYYPSSMKRSLRNFAPHQPRIDHNLFYEGIQQPFALINFLNPFASITGPFSLRLAHRLLEGSPHVLSFFEPNDFTKSSTLPNRIRVSMYNYRFSTPKEYDTNHEWFVRQPLQVVFTYTLRSSSTSLFAYLPVRFISTHNAYWNRVLPVPSLMARSSTISSSSSPHDIMSSMDDITYNNTCATDIQYDNDTFMNSNHTTTTTTTTSEDGHQSNARSHPSDDPQAHMWVSGSNMEELRSGPAGGQESSLQRLLERSVAAARIPAAAAINSIEPF